MTRHCPIYSKLVSSPNDLVGVIAYSRYKNQKVEWIKVLLQKNGVDELPDAEMQAFHDIACTEASIAGYRLQATEILETWVQQSLSEQSNEIANAYELQFQEELKNIELRYRSATEPLLVIMKENIANEMAKVKPGFLAGVSQNVIANLVIIVCTAIILLVIWSLKFGFVNAFGDAMGYEVKAKVEGSTK